MGNLKSGESATRALALGARVDEINDYRRVSPAAALPLESIRMHVDIAALPIPNECDLRCPQCDYPLRGLPAHVCPECGLKIEMERLVRPWTRLRAPRLTGRELPLPDFGLTCGRCGAELAGAERHACGACGTPFDPQAQRPRAAWTAVDRGLYDGLAASIVEMLLIEEQIPHTMHEGKTAVDHYTGSNPLGSRGGGTRIMLASEFFFEVLALLQRTRRSMAAARAAAGESTWTCPRCGEDSPGHFEICWNCEAARGGG